MKLQKKLLTKVIVLSLAGAMVSACVTGTASREDKMANGSALGALVGGFLAYTSLGGSTADHVWLGTILGGVAGGYAGYHIMDQVTLEDKQELDGMIYRSLTDSENGETLTWQASEKDTMGHFTPVRTFMDQKGRICRDLMVESVVDGSKNYATQTMCKNGAGHWVVS